MSRGIYDYLEFAGNALFVDTTIRAFCQLHFEKNLSVFIGQDETDLPSEALCPMVIITGGTRGNSESRNLKTRSAGVLIAIRDAMTAEKEANTTGVVVFPGLAKLDELADMISKALVNLPLHPSGAYVSDLEEGPPDVIEFPVYKAFIGLSIMLDSEF